MTQNRKEYAIYVITKHGVEIAKRLLSVLKDADLFVSPKFIAQAPEGAKLLSLPMDATLRETFQSYYCHIHIISVGAVVRMIAPLLVSKKTDPAIVCVDDKAKFSICVLSGHVGRGNEYTSEISRILENVPVITTASDAAGTLTVDILGRNLGWQLDDPDRNVTRGCAAVVNETRVAFIQESGSPDWWPLNQSLPKGVEYYSSLNPIQETDFEILLIASDRTDLHLTHPRHFENSVVYRPKSLVLGIGCDRQTPVEVLERGMKQILSAHRLDLRCVKAIASVDAKKNEAGLLALSQKYGFEFHTYPAEVLDQVEGIANPSEMPKLHVGTRSVSEAAALLCAKTYAETFSDNPSQGRGLPRLDENLASQLLVPKQKYREEEGGKNMTLAIVRIPYPSRSA